MIYNIKSLQVPEEVQQSSYYDKWLRFHLDNRNIIRMILDELNRAKSKGLKKVSIKQIIGKIRWEKSLETVSEDFRINDAFTSIYAHVIAYNFDEYKSLFDCKPLRAKK